MSKLRQAKHRLTRSGGCTYARIDTRRWWSGCRQRCRHGRWSRLSASARARWCQTPTTRRRREGRPPGDLSASYRSALALAGWQTLNVCSFVDPRCAATAHFIAYRVKGKLACAMAKLDACNCQSDASATVHRMATADGAWCAMHVRCLRRVDLMLFDVWKPLTSLLTS